MTTTRALLNGAVGGPGRLMISTWVFTLLLYTAGPFRYDAPPRVWTLAFITLCVIAFAAGSAVTRLAFAAAHEPGEVESPEEPASIDAVLKVFALLGIAGALLVGYDKLVLTGVDFSEGLGTLRIALQMEFEEFKVRSPALWVGTLLYSFSNVAFLLYLFAGERVSRRTGLVVVLSALSPVFVVVLYGGRSSAILLLVLMVAAVLVRVACGQRPVPRAPYLWQFSVVFAALVTAGSLYIFAARAEILSTNRDPGADVLHLLLRRSEMAVSEPMAEFIAGDSAVAASTRYGLMAVAYVAHPVPELDYLLHENADAGPFWGEYQGWVASRAVRVVLGLPDRAKEFDYALHRAGLFMTAWGSMFLDFGFWGALLVLVLFGALAAYVHRRTITDGGLPAKMFLAYVYMFVLMSPLHSGLNIGNSLQILACLGVAALVLRRRPRPGLAVAIPAGAGT